MKPADVAGAIEQGIAGRRAQMERLEREIAALEATLGILGGQAAEAPPKARKKPGPRPKTAKPQTSAPTTKKRTKSGDSTFGCGHERSTENTNTQGKCRECTRASQLRYLAKKKARASAAPAEEPAPVESAPPAPAPEKLSTPSAKVLVMSEASKVATSPSIPAAPKWPKRDDYKPPPRDNRFYAGRGWR